MRAVLAAIVVGLSLVLTIVSQVAAMGTLDQSYEPSSGFIPGASAYDLGEAQVFTAGISGVLDTVALDGAASDCPGLTHTVQIRSVTAGEPDGNPGDSSDVLAEETGVECQAGFYNITFSDPATVVAGQQYAIVFSVCCSAMYHQLVEPTGTYAGGAACGWIGTAWNCAFGGDWLFRTYVSPAPAAKPDLLVRKGSQANVGNNVYNADATSQSVFGAKAIGRTITFYLTLQNDGPKRDSFRFDSSGAFNDGYKVRYFDASNDITNMMSHGRYVSPTLRPGSKYVIRATVKVRPGATVGSSVSRLVTASSTTFSGAVDAVRFTASRK